MAKEYDRRKSFGTFMHRHGHQFVGLLVLAGFLTVGYIGYRESHPKVPTYEEILGVDKLKLSYDISAEGFDGEMFLYSVYFDHDPADEDVRAVEECMESFPQNDENTYHGDVMVFSDDPDKVTVMLDLGNAYDSDYITDIPIALDAVDGIKKVIINEGAE